MILNQAMTSNISKLLHLRVLWACLVCFLFTGVGAPETLANADHHRILVLHSYHKGLSWTDAISTGIENVLHGTPEPITIEYAFMDTKRIFNPAYIDQLVELYTVKFRDRKFDAIISSDDHAFRFLLRHQGQLFANTPVIFCGVNDFTDDMLSEKPNFTGVLESFDMLATINTALDLQPKARRLIAISDQTVSGQANRKLFETIISQIHRPVSITILDNHTMAELTSHLETLSPDDIVVWLVFSVSRDGKFYSFEESTRTLSSHSPAPMYSFWDFNLGHGIVGGKLTNGTLQGEKAAGFALRILRGESILDLPVIRKSPNQYMFDYRWLKRFGLKMTRLPPDSVIINRPKTLYSQNKALFWSVITIFFSLTTIIIALLMAIASRKKTERALIASKDRYQNVFNSASVALFEADFSAVHDEIKRIPAQPGKTFSAYLEEHTDEVRRLVGLIEVKDVNAAAVLLLKAPDAATLINLLLSEILPYHSRVIREMLICLANDREYFMWEDEIENLDGETLHVVLNLNFPQNKRNYRTMVFSIFDITDRKLSEQALRRSEDRFRTVFNQAASGMALIDLDGSFLRVNGALTQMLGYTDKEMLKGTWEEMTYEDDIKNSQGHVQKVIKGQMVHPIEKRCLHKNGSVVDVLFNIAAIFDKEERPLYLIAQFQDITQIKAAQAALNERDERYRQLFEADLSGVYITTPDGNLVMCNDVLVPISPNSTKTVLRDPN